MKYIFRGYVVFEYLPDKKEVILPYIDRYTDIKAYDFCRFIPEDYQLMSEFFGTVYRHIQGEEVVLKDIVVD